MTAVRAIARPTSLAALKKLYDFGVWGGSNRLPMEFLVRRYLVREQTVPQWQLIRARDVRLPDGLRIVQAFWTKAGGGDEELIRFDVFESASRLAAHTNMVRILASSEVPSGFIRRANAFGDVAFVGPHDTFAAFARGNLLLLVRNAGRRAVEVPAFANDLDHDLISTPSAADALARPADGAPQFRRLAADRAAAQRGVVPIDLDVDRGSDPVCVKVVSPSGTLFMRDGRVMYRQSRRGMQEVSAYATATGGATSQATMRFDRVTRRKPG
jgi:hypothetical protein